MLEETNHQDIFFLLMLNNLIMLFGFFGYSNFMVVVGSMHLLSGKEGDAMASCRHVEVAYHFLNFIFPSNFLKMNL